MIKQAELQESARIGLIAGAVTLAMCMIGIMESFNERDIITDTFTLGQFILYGLAILAGFMAVNRQEITSPAGKAVNGLLAGLLSGVPVFLLILLAGAWENIREAFINVSKDLLEIITLGNENAVAGGLLLIVMFGVLGLIGAIYGMISQEIRSAVMTGLAWSLGVGMMSEIVIGILRSRLSRDTMDLLFGNVGLTLPAFVGLFVLTAAGSYWWRRSGGKQYGRMRASLSPSQLKASSYTTNTLLVLLVLVLPSLLGVYLSEIFNTVALYVLMGLGLNIAVGLAGLLDLGYVTNFAIGAYVMALLTSNSEFGLESPISFWFALPICILAGMIAGFAFALPVLKMRGDYLAIATLGFGEIIRILARSDAMKSMIGGAQGILQVPQARIAGAMGGLITAIVTPINNFLEPWQLGILSGTDGVIVFGKPPQLYYLVLVCCFIMLFILRQLNNSSTGRRWMAIREDEDVAAAMGINTTNAKVVAFTLSAASGGLAGALFAAKIGSVFPQSFSLIISVNVLSLIIVGGLGSLPGIVVGAFALIGVPELLREFAEFRILLYGIALIGMMLYRPEGLWPSEARRRELRGEDDPPIPQSTD
ncbi:MAG: branched-chain amino acid ABC transporter permease [Candidatus Promineifilaceae bacterium]